ncbi:MAG: hypothetical protein WD607_01155 [Candidatus Paceibacterota bacterium]
MKKLGVLTLLFIAIFLSGQLIALAQTNSESLTVYFFYSPTCPYCHTQSDFLDKIEPNYPEVNIERFNINNTENHDLLRELSAKHNAERFLGTVPITFIGEDFFLGFDNELGIGKDIERSIERQSGIEAEDIETPAPSIPIINNIDTENASLLGLAAILGFLDGFNVCSLGALLLILGLVISLRSRKKIIVLGGSFILITSITYGLLIFLWYQLFSLFSGYLTAIQIIIGLLGVAGGIYFLNEFRQFRKYGPTCSTSGSRIISKISGKVEEGLKSKSNLIFLIGLVLVFGALVTIIEFPCSAAIPVIFTGILSQQGLSFASYIFYIGIFLLFYLIDELIIFLVAIWKMDIWMTSPKFVTWATLIQGLVLISFGLYYLLKVI